MYKKSEQFAFAEHFPRFSSTYIYKKKKKISAKRKKYPCTVSSKTKGHSGETLQGVMAGQTKYLSLCFLFFWPMT